MLKWRPPVIYKYLWKYVCPLAMIGLLAASLLRMVFKGPTYTAWNQDTVRYQSTVLFSFCFGSLTHSCIELHYKQRREIIYWNAPSALKSVTMC